MLGCDGIVHLALISLYLFDTLQISYKSNYLYFIILVTDLHHIVMFNQSSSEPYTESREPQDA